MKERGQRGQWAQVRVPILEGSQRAAHLPQDTRARPYEMFVKGFLVDDAAVGENARVRTLAGRELRGTLVALEPRYDHTFGDPIAELLSVGDELKSLLGSENDEDGS